MQFEMRSVIPVLRMFDVTVTKRFYVDYLGCELDWQEGDDPDRSVFMQVSRRPMRLNLSSHHDDGTPGSVVLIFASGIADLHAELASKGYPFLNPGIEPHGPGHELQLIDPASNRLRFFEPPPSQE